MKELELLEHLEVLTIDIRSSLAVEQLINAPRLVRCIQKVSITELGEQSFIMTLPTMDKLRQFTIWGCGMKEIKIERASSSRYIIPSAPCLSNLGKVIIKWCGGLKHLTWLLDAPNLTYLEVDNSDQVEDIIKEEETLSSVTNEESCTITPFMKLEYLHLSHLLKLKSIYGRPLPFPCLKEIQVNDCPELRRLPLDSKSGCASKGLAIRSVEKEWIEKIEWEDEPTKLHFLPSCKFDTCL